MGRELLGVLLCVHIYNAYSLGYGGTCPTGVNCNFIVKQTISKLITKVFWRVIGLFRCEKFNL